MKTDKNHGAEAAAVLSPDQLRAPLVDSGAHEALFTVCAVYVAATADGAGYGGQRVLFGLG